MERFSDESTDHSTDHSSGSDDERDRHNRFESEEENVQEVKLSITEDLARKNYVRAGEEVEEEPDKISVAANTHLMNQDVNVVLDRILPDLNLPYEPSEFQRLGVNVVGSQRNLILVSPTGSGKMDVPFLSVLVLREIAKNPEGVCIVTQPLTSIMNEKLKSNICPVASLSMTGQLKFGVGDKEEDASLSCDLEDLLKGKFPVLMGHPESFDSILGQHILRELQKLERKRVQK